jgi:aspartate beta-hydroxylase
MPDIYDRTADLVRNIYDRRIDTPAILDIDRYFPDGMRFAASWEKIRDEALAISGQLRSVPRFHELMSSQSAISANDGLDWRIFVLKAYGHDVRGNQERCPLTTELVRNCPNVLSASFSFLAPGKHIPAHRGPFRGVLRFHLGLSMPVDGNGTPGAILWIDGEEHRMANGDCLLWDDTYRHEVLNTTNEVRTALLLDVWRPEMPADMIALSHVIVAAARVVAYVNSGRSEIPPSVAAC